MKCEHSISFRASSCVLAGLLFSLPLAAQTKVEPKPAGELTATEWAGETLLGSPVGITLDNLGRAYVTQTTRRKESELDIRSHTAWIPQTLAMESVEDREKFYRSELSAERSAVNQKWLKDRNDDGVSDMRDLGVLSELVLRVEDKAGRGVADTRTVFADGLNSEMTGVAGGVLWAGGSVYLTAIPSVWRFDAQRQPGAADVKTEEMLTGFGVHVAYSGHDMHGLTMGPDGRIYWSIGDKGLNVALPDGRRAKNAHSGAVLRCEPDGSGFEIFAGGLRNPQELAFDEWGNLFSVDNDGDFKGERERFVYITERSDTGWRCNWQYRKGDYNPWLDEKLSIPAWRGQAAYITPPLGNYSDGPCGFAYNPGTALGAKYRGTFFLTQFPARKLTAFKTEAAGAGFKMVDERLVFSGPMMTGLAWGPDGALYVADWNSPAWEPHNKGKIWKLDAAEPDPLRAETRKLLAEGMATRAVAELGQLLAHADQRVRLGAQFELAKRGDAAALLTAARMGSTRLARVHGIWGLGQISRRRNEAAAPLLALLTDEDAEVRAQSAKILGDVRHKPAAEGVAKLLADVSERVRFHAAIAIAKIGGSSAMPMAIAMIEKNNGADLFLRHAGITALAGICAADAQPLGKLSASSSEEVRLSAVVALRRLADPGVAAFLADGSPLVVAEAARAIHDDDSIPAALAALAALLDHTVSTDAVIVRRAISANLRIGGAEAARRLAAYSTRVAAPVALRTEALTTLATWIKPDVVDRVEGRHRPLEPRAVALLHAALDGSAPALFADSAPEVLAAACELAGRASYAKAGPQLLAAAANEQQPFAVRRAALAALAAVKAPTLPEAIKTAMTATDAALRADALKLFAASGNAGKDAVPLLEKVLERGSPDEQQTALATLGSTKSAAAAKVLAAWVEKLTASKVAPALQLDVLDAVRAHGAPALLDKLAAYEKGKPASDPLTPFRETLQGGNAARGKILAMEHLAAQCTRCHKVGGAGAEIGPDLGRVAARLSREKLLESLVAPGAQIAEGFGVIVVTLKGGRSVSGTVPSETAAELTIRALDGVVTKIAKADIKERTQPASMMPPVGALLTARELRDVVEFLTTLK